MLLVPLTVQQIHSMQAMQAHAPEMKAIQQQLQGRQAEAQRGADEVLPENNDQPGRSCLPLLVQFPVFIALYLVLRHFSKHPPAATCLARRSSRHHGARERALVGLPAARDLRRQPARVDVLHVDDDGQDAADDDDGPPGRVRPVIVNFPSGSSSTG
jgi:hypothetical protein